MLLLGHQNCDIVRHDSVPECTHRCMPLRHCMPQ
jgi:hypothetical protein